MVVLTEKGFKRPTYGELLAGQEARAKKLFGEDIDTSGESAMGKYIRINVYDLDQCYELLEDVYYARFPNSARGQSLERLCPFAGVVRDPSTASKIKVRFYGNAGAIVPAAFQVSGAGIFFHADRDYTIESDGTAIAYLNCLEFGTAGNLPLGTELTIVNPNADIERVEFVEIASYGRDKEKDAALRVRFNKSVAGSGSATTDAIRGAIFRVPLVEGVAVIENDTEKIVDGRPPNTFQCYVLAPESQDQLVAEAIFSKKPLGIKSLGDIEIEVIDKGRKPHIVRFSRTVRKEIYLKVEILTNQFFESDGTNKIKDNLMEYINNLTNGDPVYVSSLYGYIHEVHGVVNVQSLTISDNGTSYTTANIAVEDYEIARISAEHIEIGVVT